MDTSCLLPEWYDINPDIEKNLKEYLTTPVKKRQRPPAGFSWKEGDEFCYPNETLLQEVVRTLADVRYSDKRSLREGVDYLRVIFEEEGYDPIGTAGGLSNIFTRLEKVLGIFEGEQSSVERLKTARKKKIEERKAEGRSRSYCFSKEVQKRVDEQKKLTLANKELELLKKKEARLKKRAAKQARKLKLKGDPTELSKASKKEKTQVDTTTISKDREVAFMPNPGPQTEFLSADEDIVLYGGAAGGGKSYAMVVDPLRYAHHKGHRAVLIRKTMPELKEIIDVSKELYPKYDPKAKYRESDHIWKFSSGAEIMFKFLEKAGDKEKFQGIAYTYIGFDELSQHATPEGFNYVRSRLRRTKENADIKPYIRATANPGSMWVYEMFIKDKEPNKAFILPGTENSKRPMTAKFIPAKLEDNPYLDEDGMYRTVLESLDETLKRQLLEGDWLASNDNMFNEFKIDTHVIEPFTVPRHWTRFAGLDYGYKDPSAGVWGAVDPTDGSIIIYDEFLESGLTGKEFAIKILEKEADELVPVDHPIDWSIYAKTGHTGPTIAESMLSVKGLRIRKADKNREAGWVQVHEMLRPDPQNGIPRMRIFSSCKNLIKQLLSVKVHPNKPGDIDQTRNSDGHWDLLDALRYGVMSRPRMQTHEDRLLTAKNNNTWDKYRGYFR